MTLQWTVVAVFLYIEVGIIALFLLPWIRPNMWNKLFKSRLLRSLESYSHVYSWAFAGILLLLFFDGIREVHKYSDVDPEITLANAQSEALVHMKLFRAQRNLYISGFALFLWLVIRRMMNLIKHEAQLQASADAAMKQARSATDAAQDLMAKPDASEELRKEVEKAKNECEKAKTDRDAVMKQAQGLQNEYDRMCDDFNKLQEENKRLEGIAAGDKKSD